MGRAFIYKIYQLRRALLDTVKLGVEPGVSFQRINIL